MLRVGDIATVFYELRVGEELKVVNVGTAEVIESTSLGTLLELDSATEVQASHQARFEIPLARLSPSDLARLVEKGAEDPESMDEDPALVAEQREEAAPEPTDRPEDPLLTLVDTWREAWQRQDVTAYLACYSAGFVPDDGSTLEAWRNLRTQRLEAPAFIELMVDDVQLALSGDSDDNEIRVLFDQTFRSDGYRDVVRKELILVREVGSWRILRERSLP